MKLAKVFLLIAVLVGGCTYRQPPMGMMGGMGYPYGGMGYGVGYGGYSQQASIPPEQVPRLAAELAGNASTLGRAVSGVNMCSGQAKIISSGGAVNANLTTNGGFTNLSGNASASKVMQCN